MSTPTTLATHNLFASSYQKAALYVALTASIILQATLATGPLSVLTPHPTATFILATAIIAASTFCALLTGRTWNTRRPRAALLGATTVLLSTTVILAVLATPYLYLKTHTGYTGYSFLESLTWRTDYTALIIHTVFTLATITIAALYGHHTTKNHNHTP